jgi:radical SAM/Cys-rich protein
MNDFEKRVQKYAGNSLQSVEIATLQVNVGLRCNQHCKHCHVLASPARPEVMEWPVMELGIEAAGKVGCEMVDITGGAPELNPNLRRFIETLRLSGHRVQLRTNLTALLEPDIEITPEWLRDHQVQLVASMPCYLEENVRAQRGGGVYEKSIAVIKRLNFLGYGVESGLTLNLIYNPGGPFLPPRQSELEADYRDELKKNHGITFSHLHAITNIPIGRFREELRRRNQEEGYLRLLRDSFNPQTVDGLMCRHQISVGWDGTLFDCDFNLALGHAVDHGAPDHIRSFDPNTLRRRRIVTGEHCFGCTAGAGSSCGGSLI